MMRTNTGARKEMLLRMRKALQDVPANEQREPLVVERSYRPGEPLEQEALIKRFIERVTDYKVLVRQVEERQCAQTIATICAERGIRRLAVPADVPPDWLPPGREILSDDPPLSYEQLDHCDGVLTGCTLGIAQTGTIVLDGGATQGRRVLTLLPDYHLCVMHEKQIVDLVPEAIQALGEAVKHHHRPLTFISGPSATSDIELNRVEGVHGPRTLEVLVIRAKEAC
jgi:L-lactate dehydrogenase complex protein LldG